MKDKEIKKALECCAKNPNEFICTESKCPLFGQKCSNILADKSLDLINRQQAEIERLEVRLRKERHQFEDLGKMYSEIRAEAIKELIDKLEYDYTFEIQSNNYWEKVVRLESIKKVAKEMVGEQE
jgi:hypothetical protein